MFKVNESYYIVEALTSMLVRIVLTLRPTLTYRSVHKLLTLGPITSMLVSNNNMSTRTRSISSLYVYVLGITSMLVRIVVTYYYVEYIPRVT